MDNLKEFENKVTKEYVTNHSLQLMKETLALAKDFSDVEDPALVYEHQISISAQHRFVSLALLEYHALLSRYLSKHGIDVPDLDTLISESYND